MKTKKRTQKLKRYAMQFCDLVHADFPQLTNKKPIVLCDRLKGTTEQEAFSENVIAITEKTTKGKVILDGFYSHKNGTVTIFNIIRERMEELKRSVRHECLHFLLHESGLPYDDDTALFVGLACKYDARPYALWAFIADKMKGEKRNGK